MITILNIGSLNIDHVYHVAEFVKPGETLACTAYRRYPGGKGLNQSVAAARAGGRVRHVGAVGGDGGFLSHYLDQAGVDTSSIAVIDTPTGHAIIQINGNGENCIVLFGGANQMVSPTLLTDAFAKCSSSDLVLLQNETSGVEEAIREAHRLGLRVALNPAPCTDAVRELPLHLLSYLFVNETEAEAICGTCDPHAALAALRELAPGAVIVLTLGAKGSMAIDLGNKIWIQAAHQVETIDTTAAGDTFIGYFLTATVSGAALDIALHIAGTAAAICVSRSGAAPSIPERSEVEKLLQVS